MKALTSSTKPGDGTLTVPMRVALSLSGNKPGEWVVHIEDMKTGNKFAGHYFTPNLRLGGTMGANAGAYVRALNEYLKRCKALGVDPRLDEQREEAKECISCATTLDASQWDETLMRILTGNPTRIPGGAL